MAEMKRYHVFVLRSDRVGDGILAIKFSCIDKDSISTYSNYEVGRMANTSANRKRTRVWDNRPHCSGTEADDIGGLVDLFLSHYPKTAKDPKFIEALKNLMDHRI